MEIFKSFKIRYLAYLFMAVVIFSVILPDKSCIAENTEFLIEDGILKSYGGTGSHVVIPSTVTKIGEKAFYKNETLKTIVIPASVTEIGKESFAYCTSLVSVTMPNSLKIIGEWAFAECTVLNSVKFGNAVETVGEWAFYYCSSLEKVAVGDSVNTVGKFSFKYCSKNLVFLINDNTYMQSYCAKYKYNWEKNTEDINKINQIFLDKSEIRLKAGESIQLSVQIIPDNSSNQSLIWNSDNSLIAMVDKTGLITAVGNGKTIIRCTAKDGGSARAECLVIVEEEGEQGEDSSVIHSPKPEGKDVFELSQDNIIMEVGQSDLLECYAVPRQKILFRSDNTAVAEISPEGEIKAKKGGIAVITATAEDGRVLECLVRVRVHPKTVKLNKTKLIMKIGEKFKLKASISPREVSKELKVLYWQSNNKNVATISKTGYVRAKSEGACTIRVETENGIQATCKIIIMDS